MNSMRVVGEKGVMQTLSGYGGLSVVRATAVIGLDGRWTVIAYGEDDVVDTLRNDGFEVTVLRDSEQMEADWQTVQAQVEDGKA